MRYAAAQALAAILLAIMSCLTSGTVARAAGGAQRPFVVTIHAYGNTPYTGVAGHDIDFNATASGITKPRFHWDFGDGSSGDGPALTHAYAAAGMYTVTLTVVDGSSGSKVQATTTATVAPAGPVVTYPAGWNLVAGPAGMLFLDAGGPLYTFQPGDTAYETRQPIFGVQAGRGYWAYFPVRSVYAFSGVGMTSVTLQAPAGQWIMIGNPSGTDTLTIRGADLAFGWNPASGSYEPVTSLTPGMGAWIYSATGGTVSLAP